jgi:hypothetical protein
VIVFDVGFGVYTGIGYDFSRQAGFQLRGMWAPPFFHAYGDNPETENFTIGLTFDFYKR